MAITSLGGFITGIQGRTTATVTYSVAPSTVNQGWTDILRNGVRLWSFLWAGWAGATWRAREPTPILTVFWSSCFHRTVFRQRRTCNSSFQASRKERK
jgi:hypothetical protein